MNAADLLYLLTLVDQTDSGTSSERVAYYGMWSALGVAFIGGVFALGKSYFGNAGTAAKTRRVVKEHEAWEKFLLLNQIDPRKIRTGYERMEEVRRAVVSPAD